jgi:hypothetical protein
MNVQYTANAQQRGEDSSLIQHATNRLDEILGSASEVKVEWDRLADKTGRTLYRLTLADLTGHVSTDFTPDELRNPLYLHVSLYRLWGDLLQRHSDEQHKVVQAMLDRIGTGQEGD